MSTCRFHSELIATPPDKGKSPRSADTCQLQHFLNVYLPLVNYHFNNWTLTLSKQNTHKPRASKQPENYFTDTSLAASFPVNQNLTTFSTSFLSCHLPHPQTPTPNFFLQMPGFFSTTVASLLSNCAQISPPLHPLKLNLNFPHLF